MGETRGGIVKTERRLPLEPSFASPSILFYGMPVCGIKVKGGTKHLAGP